MKLTKVALRRLIKEELLKEGRSIDSTEVAEEAVSLGRRIESELDDMDVDLSTLVANVDRMYQDFRAFLVEYVEQETGRAGIRESRRRSRRK